MDEPVIADGPSPSHHFTGAWQGELAEEVFESHQHPPRWNPVPSIPRPNDFSCAVRSYSWCPYREVPVQECVKTKCLRSQWFVQRMNVQHLIDAENPISWLRCIKKYILTFGWSSQVYKEPFFSYYTLENIHRANTNMSEAGVWEFWWRENLWRFHEFDSLHFCLLLLMQSVFRARDRGLKAEME